MYKCLNITIFNCELHILKVKWRAEIHKAFNLFLCIVSMRLVTFQNVKFLFLNLKSQTILLKYNCISQYLNSDLSWRKSLYAYYLSLKRPLHIRLRIQPLLVAPCLAIKLPLPSIKCSLFLIMHRLPVLSINKTEMSWTSLRGITIRRGKFASGSRCSEIHKKNDIYVLKYMQYNIFINIYLWDDGTFNSKPRLPFLTVSRLTFVFEVPNHSAGPTVFPKI